MYSKNRIIDAFYNWLHGYDNEKYWKRRAIVIGDKKASKLWRFYCLLWCRRVEVRHQAFLSTRFNGASRFLTPPHLPHGLNGIHVTGMAVIGRNCTILQHVTIGNTRRGTPRIGDNVIIGAGAVIIGNVTVGDNCNVGANATVVKDVPPNTTVVSQPARYLPNKDLSKDRHF